MNCPYCNHKMLPDSTLSNIQLFCDECPGKPTINNWYIVPHNQFIHRDLYVKFTVDINFRSYAIWFNPNDKKIIIREKNEDKPISLRINDLVTPSNVFQVTDRILNMKVFL